MDVNYVDLITTIGLNTCESKCLSLCKLRVFQLIKNEMPFLHYSKYMKKYLLENTQFSYGSPLC